MRTASAGYWSKVFTAGRNIAMSVTITSTDPNQSPVTLTNSDIKSFTLEEQLMNDEQFELSNCIAKTFNFSFYDPTGSVWAIGLGGAKVEVSININDGTPADAVAYVPYYVNKLDRNGMVVSCECIDCIGYLDQPYTSNILNTTPPGVPTVANVLSEICTQCGLDGYQFTGSIPTGGTGWTMSKPPEGLTCRQVVGYIAQLFGLFAVAKSGTGLGYINFIDTTATNKTVYTYSIFKEKVSGIRAHLFVLEYEDKQYAPATTFGQFIRLPQNPVLDATIYPTPMPSTSLAFVGEKYKPDAMGYYPAQITMQSCPAFEVGDFVTMSRKDNTTFRALITHISQSSLGVMTVRAAGKTGESREYVTQGRVNTEIQSIKDEMASTGYTTGTTTKGSIDWHWKKWASGDAECWGVFEFTPNNLQSLVSNWYYQYTPLADVALPFTFATLEVFLCSGRSASSAAIIQPHTSVPGTNITNLQMLITQATNTARKQTISMLCKGTWK